MAAKKEPAKKTEAIVADAPVEEPKAPKPKYAEDDNSIDARMWRLEQDHKRMGSR
jgi:hypothetical protein